MITEVARAKLNLALHVRARRADGYHAIETLFAFVAVGDTLRVEAADTARFKISGPFGAALCGDSNNLVTDAVAAFARDVAPLPPLAIELVKHLPVASGIGGGSADAAATLRACCHIAGVDRDDARVLRVAEGLGSDVPACMFEQTAIGTGRGDALMPVDGLAGMPALLINPRVAVNTGTVFARWDAIDRGPLPTGDAWTIARTGRNDLTAAAKSIAPVIGEVIDALNRLDGTTLVRMSGSGATCFALFANDAARDAAGQAVRTAYPDWWCLETALV